MKKVLLSMVLVFIAGTAWGHPASSEEISYAPETGILTVTAMHKVQDPTTHYISKYVVLVDGKEVAREELSGQTNAEKSVLSLSLPDLKQGDVVTVTATCNKFGERTGTLTIE